MVLTKRAGTDYRPDAPCAHLRVKGQPLTDLRLDHMEITTDDWAARKEAPPFTAPIQLAMVAIAAITIVSGTTLMSQTAYQAGPTQSYVSAWCLTTIGFHMIAAIVAAENYRRMKSLGRGKKRMQIAQLRLRDGQRELTVGQAELRVGQEKLREGQENLQALLVGIEDRIADATAQMAADREASGLARTEFRVMLEEVRDGVNFGVSAIEQAYGVAAGPARPVEHLPRRLRGGD